nr:hypothetical protein [Actinomycetota bacterium]
MSLVVAGAPAAVTGGVYTPPPQDWAPVWSPDGTVIAYHSERAPRGLRVVEPDGSGDRRLPLPEPRHDEPATFVFSPDWFWIAFGGEELVVSRPDGSDRHVVARSNYASKPSWSPARDRLVFEHLYALHVANVDGSGLRELTPSGGEPAWSPDGELIAFRRGTGDRSDVFVIRPDGSGETNVSAALGGFHIDPVWSPDGRRVAFFTRDAPRSAGDVTVVERDGTLVGRFEPDALSTKLAWSPDGQRLLLSGPGVFELDIRTGARRIVSPFGADATWAPDGGRVAFDGIGECRNRVGIYVADTSTRARKRLTNGCRIVGTSRADSLR